MGVIAEIGWGEYQAYQSNSIAFLYCDFMSRMKLFVDREDALGAGLNLSDPNSPLAPYFVPIGHVLATVIVAAVFIFLNFVPLNHTDIWAHLKFGEHILDSHKFLAGETFCTFASPQTASGNYCWLSQTLFAAVYRIGTWFGGADPHLQMACGADSLRFLHAILVSLRFALLYFAFRRMARSGTIAAFGLAFVTLVSIGSLGVLRPQVVAELLFAAILMPLSRSPLSLRATIFIPLVMALWGNAHGSYPIGLIMLATAWFARLMELAVGHQLHLIGSDSHLRRLTLALTLTVVAIALLNPDGYRVYLNTLAMAQNPNVTLMDEWLPLWSENTVVACVAFSVCIGFVMFAVIAGRNPGNWLTWLTLIAFGGQAVLHQRGVIWLFMIAPWIAMPHLGDAFVLYRPATMVSVPSFRKTLVVGMITFIAVMWSLPLQRLTSGKAPELVRSVSDGTPWLQSLAVSQPDRVTDAPLTKAIRKIFADGRFTGAIYVGDTLGDFFLWQLPSPAPIYMYSHVQLFSADHWQRYTMIRDCRDGWRQELDRARINLIVVRPAVEPGICQTLRKDANWTVVTDEANLTTKRDQRNRLFVALRKVPLSDVAP